MEEQSRLGSLSMDGSSADTPHLHLLEGHYSVFAMDHAEKLLQPDLLPVSIFDWDSDFPKGFAPQIVLNGTYICYFPLSCSCVGILGRNVASRGLFCRHSSTVSDMAFFAETEDLAASVSSDGSLFVWRIIEHNDEHDDFQLHEQVTLAIQFQGSWKDLQPRVCWHASLQEWLVVCISDSVFTVNIKEAQKTAFNLGLSADTLVSCPTTNPIDGVQLTGQHDAEVTNVSMFTGQSLYIASASRDGMVKIWQGSVANPLAVLLPYEGQPVGSAIFVSCPQYPSKARLLTQDATLQRLKLWMPETSSATSWCLTQTVEFTVSGEGDDEQQKFLTRFCFMQEAGLLLFGSLRTLAVYAIHLRFEETSGAVCMDYLTYFSVPMRVLSMKAMADTGGSLDKGTIKVFCVHPKDIHEYHLNMSHLLPHGNEPVILPTNLTRVVREDLEKHSVECPERNNGPGLTETDLTSCVSTGGNVGPTSKHDNASAHSGAGFGSWVEVPTWIAATIKKGMKMGPTETTRVKNESTTYLSSPRVSKSDSASFMSTKEVVSTPCSITNTALPGCEESIQVSGGCCEGVEETQEARPEMHESANNGVEEKPTTVPSGWEPHLVEGNLLVDRCQETFRQASTGPANNTLEDLSAHISATQGSIDLILTSQMELQKNFCTLAEASLAVEIGHMDFSVEERLNSYYDTCFDPVWRQFDDSGKHIGMLAHMECVHQVELEINKIVDGEDTSDLLKGDVLSLFGPKIGELIAANVENIITAALSHLLKGRNKKLFKSLEACVGGILKSLVKPDMESAFLTIWNNLMQVDDRMNFVLAFNSNPF